MKSLIILADRDPDALGGAIARAAAVELRRLGAPVRLHDLYALRFQPAIQASDFEAWGRGEQPVEVKPLQADVAWAELLILVYPNFWGGTPAILKGYIDRVFAMGFAYGVREGKMAGFLEGKRALLCPTTEEPAGLTESMRRVMGAATLAFCGVEIAGEQSLVAASALGQVQERIRELITAGH